MCHQNVSEACLWGTEVIFEPRERGNSKLLWVIRCFSWLIDVIVVVGDFIFRGKIVMTDLCCLHFSCDCKKEKHLVYSHEHGWASLARAEVLKTRRWCRKKKGGTEKNMRLCRDLTKNTFYILRKCQTKLSIQKTK